jgi:crotonobetainyl-CoA:carnitine CoA-transferase CaiB-like acyl-CoA transferase
MGGERFCQPVSRLDAGNPMSGTLYPTADGRWVTLTMPDTDRWWPVFAAVVGLDPSDPRFDSHDKRCDAYRLELIAVLDAIFRTRPAADWRGLFDTHALSADVIEDYAFPAADTQARRNRYVLELVHPHLGRIKTLGFPVFMSETPARLDRMAPCLGQHSTDVLQGMLGYSAAEVQQLVADGVIV